MEKGFLKAENNQLRKQKNKLEGGGRESYAVVHCSPANLFSSTL